MGSKVAPKMITHRIVAVKKILESRILFSVNAQASLELSR